MATDLDASFANGDQDGATEAQQNDLLHAEITRKARKLRDSHLINAASYARTAILNTLRSLPTAQRDYTYFSTTARRACRALDSIIQPHPGAALSRRIHVCKLPLANSPQEYTFWVPQPFYPRYQLDEPYYIYLDDDANEDGTVADLYDQMCSQYENFTGIPVLPMSDGEIDEQGNLKKLRHSVRLSRLISPRFSLVSMRQRAALRFAILNTITIHGESERVLRTLSHALDIRNWKRVQLYYKIAAARDIPIKKHAATLANVRRHNAHIRDILRSPQPTRTTPVSSTPIDSPQFAHAIQNPSACRYYCKQCSIFLCEEHDGMHTTPRIPIPDLGRDRRQNEIKSGKAKPCSGRCFLLAKHKQEPNDISEGATWLPEDICLLREAVVLFHRDPCNVAVVVGSKTCREVHAQLLLPAEVTRLEASKKAAKQPRERDIVPRRRCVSNSTGGKRRAQKSVSTAKQRNKGTIAIDTNFIPCDHVGECTEQNCPCVKNSRYCQPRCGCHGERYTLQDGGMVSEVPTCLQTGNGCNCTGGSCNTSTCDCRKYEVACVPGLCKCDAGLLPGQVSQCDRQCRNCEFIVGRHKRTYIATSRVHGFGLFAACDFEKGEIIGVYTGIMWDQEVSDTAFAIGELLSRTYAFELTKEDTVEATQMGAKVRFANHGNHQEQRNCSTDVFYIRGEACICFKTLRAIRMGEEFLLDYHLTRGNDWLHKAKRSK